MKRNRRWPRIELWGNFYFVWEGHKKSGPFNNITEANEAAAEFMRVRIKMKRRKVARGRIRTLRRRRGFGSAIA